MAITITNEERTKIIDNRKPEDQLPKVYYNSSKQNVSISRNFEYDLITKEDSVKNDALEWIDKVIDVSGQDSNRGDLAVEFINFRKQDNEAQLSEVNNLIEGFENFRSTFSDTTLQSTELGIMFEDMRSVLNWVESIRSIQEHAKRVWEVLESLESQST